VQPFAYELRHIYGGISMKKIFGFLIALVFCLFFTPNAFAQHPHGSSQGGHAQGGHANSGRQQGGHQGHARGHFQGDRGHHTNAEARGHYDGRHFDNGYRGRYFGRDHFFSVGHPVFYGGGYRFWYGGFWFGYDAWPLGWGYNDNVYIDYDGDVCYLYNPYHPGVRIALNVVF
jgi:hypothetical protein